ncbi:hypothetical protein H4683_001536 [Filibacter limicola]|uniref:Holin n=1 Tax=Sporosarcina limicola TaxID=34101 RepID=A0A927RCK4_9BACL|nr:hypothetical protein [Sporosarcina limicola]
MSLFEIMIVSIGIANLVVDIIKLSLRPEKK